MGWAVGYDDKFKRFIGYGVPAYCDHPECNEVINRGLAYVCCGEQLHGGEHGCGLYFCSNHRGFGGRCEKCVSGLDPFKPKPDHPTWVKYLLTDRSWGEWREENKEQVEKMKAKLEIK